ncbi:hypothetical protein KUTeg_021876 [Tegillarca granosa]|uniref:Uncharacterized protein n=1 Tax=Tegillarca granosa TaxID=220873 RepID=A0ABQ9E9Y6_TEGGR|nr:hypothetical protein KUTeg_021876 [Tegillarca granosa]
MLDKLTIHNSYCIVKSEKRKIHSGSHEFPKTDTLPFRSSGSHLYRDFTITCIICKKQKKPRNQILCRTNDAKCKAVQLICPDHSVIYNPDVFVDTADCAKGFYWTDICDLNDSIIIGGGSIDRGIIRSHSIMPWSYDKSVLNNQSLCRRELHPTSKQSVIITVDGINDTGIINDVIDVDNDVGYITDKDTYYNISDIVWKTKHFPVGKPVYINFGSGETKGASGFIICFKFTNEAVKSTKQPVKDRRCSTSAVAKPFKISSSLPCLRQHVEDCRCSFVAVANLYKISSSLSCLRKPVENPCCSTFAVANLYKISSSLPCLGQPLEDWRCSTFAVTNPYKISSSLPCLRIPPLEDRRCSTFAVTNPYKISSSLPCLRIPPLEDRRCSTFAVPNPYKISSSLPFLRQPLEDRRCSTFAVTNPYKISSFLQCLRQPLEDRHCSPFAVTNPYKISSSLPFLRQPLEDRRCSTFAVPNPYKISSSLQCLRQPLEDRRCSTFAVTNPYKISSSLQCLRQPLEDRRCSTFAVTNPYKISSFLQCLRQPLEDQRCNIATGPDYCQLCVVERRHVAEKEKTRNRRQRKLKEKTNENSAKGRIGGRKPKEKI